MTENEPCFELYMFLAGGGVIHLPPYIERLPALKTIAQAISPWASLGFSPEDRMKHSDHPNLWPYICMVDGDIHMRSDPGRCPIRNIDGVMAVLLHSDPSSPKVDPNMIIELLVDSEVFV